MDIDGVRQKINQLDDELLRIFNERAALALKIGELKKQQNLPVYDPSRERLIFERMKQQNPGPLDAAAVTRLFERVIDESRSLEHSHAKEDS